MRPLRTIVAGAALGALLMSGTPAHASAAGTILLPCSSPGPTYSDLINASLLPNGICGWQVTVSEASSYTLSTQSADLDLWFFDHDGESLGVEMGGSTCGAFSGVMPAATRRIVVYLTPSACDNQLNVQFTLAFTS
jgi:hypothetical protein